jgi:cellulose biosynthesis protein BcsQ
MCIVVTVMNMKGGVGKTTVTAQLGGIVARASLNGNGHKKVLLIDYDPQFNLSQALLPAAKYYDLEKQRKTCLSILQDSEAVENPYEIQVPGSRKPPDVATLTCGIYRSLSSRLDLIPSTLDLMYVALGQTERRIDPFEDRFGAFIESCRETYDYVFIDCHPAGSILTKTSLQNSDHVLIPVSPQKYALRGVQLMLKFISAKRKGVLGPQPHILFNNVPRTRISPEEHIIRGDDRVKDKCLVHTLKYFKAFGDLFEGDGFVWRSKKAWSTVAYWNLQEVATEFLDRVNGRVSP